MKVYKKLASFSAVILTLLSAIACEKELEVIHVTAVTLSSTSMTLTEGDSQTITAEVSPSNASNKNIIWSTSNSSVATVEKGRIYAAGPGTARISAISDDGGRTATCDVSVIQQHISVSNISLDKEEITLGVGSNYSLVATISPITATDRTISWTSNDERIAKVDASGCVYAVMAGTTYIVATANDNNKTASCKVNVVVPVESLSLDITELKLGIGEVHALIATITPDNATEKSVEWTTSDPTVAIVSDKGVVTGVSTGRATISAQAGEITTSCEVTVIIPVTGLSLSTSSISLEQDERSTISAIISPSNATNKEVIWKSDDSSVATISNGTVTAVNPGTTTITATSSDGGYEASCEVIVKSYSTPSKWDGVSASYDWYERGSNQTYHIKNAAELAGLSNCFSQGYYRYSNFKGCKFYLDRDIDLCNHEWTPIGILIGSTYCSFAGSFFGNGHKIEGLKISKTNNSTSMAVAGLFGCLLFSENEAQISDLSIEGEIYVNAASNLLGGLYVGGIAGVASGAKLKIKNCHSNVSIYANAITGSGINVYAGGIVGSYGSNDYSDDSPIWKCSSRGDISITIAQANKCRCGGIVGQFNHENGFIRQCSSSSDISVNNGKTADVGGIAGTTSSLGITDCLYTGDTSIYGNSGSVGYFGGMIGMPFGSEVAKNCIVLGYSSKSGGSSYLSAIFGVKSSNFVVKDCYYRSGLSNSTSYGTSMSEEEFKTGNPIAGFDTSIWSFKSGQYPSLIF